jgi:hypothetical protein
MLEIDFDTTLQKKEICRLAYHSDYGNVMTLWGSLCMKCGEKEKEKATCYICQEKNDVTRKQFGPFYYRVQHYLCSECLVWSETKFEELYKDQCPIFDDEIVYNTIQQRKNTKIQNTFILLKEIQHDFPNKNVNNDMLYLIAKHVWNDWPQRTYHSWWKYGTK